jgi:hypothetical protein
VSTSNKIQADNYNKELVIVQALTEPRDCDVCLGAKNPQLWLVVKADQPCITV